MPSLKKKINSWRKTVARPLIWKYRKKTWRRRSLPDFIIIGAQKSGTSSLFAYLSQHPQLLPSFKKEVHFFDGGLSPEIDNYEKGEAWYRAHFPLRKEVKGHLKTFEASPLYIFNPLTPKRIFEFLPEVKLIAILRNPTERAISHYFHEKRKGRETLRIHDALQEEEKRLASIAKNQDYKNEAFKSYSYKGRGLYEHQIKRYFDYFPMNQILVFNSEKLFINPDNALRQVFEFVGVDIDFKVRDLRPRRIAKNKTEIPPKVYQYLNNYFWPHNQALYRLVGKSFDW